jgi:hypothetical protein
MPHDPNEIIEGKPRLGRVLEYLVGLASRGFYGTVEIKFEAGHVQLVTPSENIRPEDLPAAPTRPK